MLRLRLLQLVSPTLPVSGYMYSQGLEYAVEAGWVRDEPSAGQWILGLLEEAVPGLDVAVLGRLYRAWKEEDLQAVVAWSRYVQASREAAERLQEDRAMGQALARLLADLGVAAAGPWARSPAATYPTAFALAAVSWGIPVDEAAEGYLWAWCEQQVSAAMRLVPLGHTAGQRLLSRAIEQIPAAARRGLALPDDAIGFVTPGLAIASARHETQYTRLFRS